MHSFNCCNCFQTKPVRITYYASDTRCCTTRSPTVRSSREKEQAERKHPIPLKNLPNLCSDLETEKKNYKQGLVQKLYIHISLKVKVPWKTKSTGCSNTR